jgi:hypothetical protein
MRAATRRERRRARAEQRRMPVAPDDLERVMQLDRLYFSRHAGRKFYLRRVYQAERAQAVRAGQSLTPPPTGMVDLVVVGQLRPDARLRVFGIAADADIDTDQVPEQEARALFFAKAPQWMLDIWEN